MRAAEFLDFSGGITDKDIPGATNRCAIADNLLIDGDKRLFSRDGFDIFSSTAYQLAAAERVSRLVAFDNDSELLAFQNKKAFAISGGAWTEVTGPSSNKAFNTNSADSLLVDTQWNKHLFLASDSGDPVIKMYRDSGGTLRLRTAGLPAFGNYSNGEPVLYGTGGVADAGLADAIALANDLRTQMISHYGSNGATAGTVETLSTRAHLSHADLTAQASAASSSSAATNLATLITLLNTLRTQYTDHIKDALKNQPNSLSASIAIQRSYHVQPASSADYYRLHAPPNNADVQVNYCWFHFLNFAAADPTFTIPSDANIATVIQYLNDLRDKWNWHNYATNTHFNAWRYRGSESFTQLGAHATSVARVEPYSWAKISPRIGAFKQYVQDLKTEFDYHRTGGMHHQSDTVTAVPSGVDSTPDDLWECVTLLGWLAHGIVLHNGDSVWPSYQLTCDSTSGSAVLVTAEASPASNALRDFWCIPIVSPAVANWALDFTLMPRGTSYRCTANTAATSITCANNFGATRGTYEFLFTASQWHLSGTLLVSADGSIGADGQELDVSFQNIDYRFITVADLQALADLAETVAGKLRTHALLNLTVMSAGEETAYGKYAVHGGKSYRRYLPSARNATGNVLDDSLYATAGYPVHMHLAAEPPLGSSLLGAIFYPASAANASGFSENRFTEDTPVAASVNYRAAFRFDYTVGSTSFTDRGPPSTPINVIEFENQEDTGSTEKGRFATEISNLYAYANASNYNYDIADTTNFRKEIYRTIAEGQFYYRADVNGVAADVANATTTYSDYSLDDYLVDQLELYTNTGAPDNDAPPLAHAVHQTNDIAYYAKGNRVYQSLPSDPDSVPGDFFEEFEENVVAISSTRSAVVVFGSSRVYRLSGVRTELGQGVLSHETIFDRTGAISAQSVVKADNGVFFAGKDGFYFTDGYQCMRVTDLEDTFRRYTDSSAKRARVQGTYDNLSKKVYWTVQTGSNSYPDKIWVLDLQFGVKLDATPVTTISCLHGFKPTALAFYGGILHYGDNDGYVFKQTLDRAIDLKKDTGVAATSWEAAPVYWDFKSCHHDYGSSAQRKYFTRIQAQFEMRDTNVSCQITSDADKGRKEEALPVIRSRKLATAAGYGDSKFDWIGNVYTTKPGDTVDEFRWLKGSGYLRSNFRSFEFELAYCVIANSTEMGTLTVANVAGNVYTATLVSLIATRKWPLYSVDYYLNLGGVEYPVTVRTSDSVVRFDATGLAAPTLGAYATWELNGVPKGERVRLVSYSVNYDLGDQEQSKFQGTTTSNEVVA